ncbi:MAG: conjugal transfer protein TraN, partial [Alphaproteobacteria bacterium]|nr:conjugal transfer protein TraN [Alphaproteobacteria bacterium]
MKILKVVMIIWVLLSSTIAYCGRFASNYPCSDTGKVCVSGAATRKIDGFDVYKDC